MSFTPESNIMKKRMKKKLILPFLKNSLFWVPIFLPPRGVNFLIESRGGGPLLALANWGVVFALTIQHQEIYVKYEADYAKMENAAFLQCTWFHWAVALPGG